MIHLFVYIIKFTFSISFFFYFPNKIYFLPLFRTDSAQSTSRIEDLLQEDRNTRQKRERIQKQSAILSKLTKHLSVHDNRAAAASNWSDGGAGNHNMPTS